MTYDNAVKHFGSPSALARALGINRASVAEWRIVGIPEGRQYQIELATNGQLRADFPPLRVQEQATA